MHFSIPDTHEFSNRQTGASYTGFNIHINGTFHCCLRYKQLHSLNEQLRRSLPTLTLPAFPSKRLLPLTPHQIEQRRTALERYIQLLGQDPVFSKSELLRCFLLSAQQESTAVECRETSVDVYLMNGFRIEVACYTTECSTKLLAKALHTINVRAEYIEYFALYLMRKQRNGDVLLVRRLLDFEAPYVSQRLQDDCRIVVRKNFWDCRHDVQLMQDSIALNLLYILTLSDVERGWILTSGELREQLHALQQAGNKREYLEVARALPYYGCLRFANARVSYPAGCSGGCATASTEADALPAPAVAAVYIGNKELCVRTSAIPASEMRFKVTLMRCWRVTTNYGEPPAVDSPTGQPASTSMELSFEYLMGKKRLQWVTIHSEQAMLMSVCLQSLVEELLSHKDGGLRLSGAERMAASAGPTLAYVRRDGNGVRRMSESSSNDTISSATNDTTESGLPLTASNSTMRRKQQRRTPISTTVLFINGKDSVHNEAFEGIGDDDL